MSINLSELFRTVMSIRRVVMKARYRVRIPKAKYPARPCFVFGNGPSLDGDIREHVDILQKCDTLCVGRFAESNLYVKIKPTYYIFADPMWWSPSAPDKTNALRDGLFSRISQDTTWPLVIFAPFEAEKYFRSVFKNLQNISLVFFNNVPLWGSEAVLTKFYDHDLGLPPAQNVLVTSLFLSIRMGYKEVVIFGADHSWHETLTLDKANRVCLRDRHFYDRDAGLRPFTMDGSDEKIFTMDTLFFALGRMFEGYWRIIKYAKHRNVNIINASSLTYIDAFDRKPACEIFFELSESC